MTIKLIFRENSFPTARNNIRNDKYQLYLGFDFYAKNTPFNIQQQALKMQTNIFFCFTLMTHIQTVICKLVLFHLI